MSIKYIVGNPGSGKTYFAVNLLYESFIKKPVKGFFSKKESKEYEVAYTNINEFDFSASDKIKKLDIAKFRDDLSDLYAIYLDDEDDEVLVKKATELGLANCLIVVDECHSTIFNNKNDEVLIWWLTYHRHLYQDIVLITQNLTLVAPAYKKIAEFFYKAIDGSNRFSKNKFKYALFNSPTMYLKRDIVAGGGITLKFNPEVFALYHSGDKTEHKSYLKYILFIVIVLAFLAFLLFRLFASLFSSDIDTTDKNLTIQSPKKEAIYSSNPLAVSYPDFSFVYNIRCFDEKCYVVEKMQFISLNTFYYLLEKYPPVFSDRTKIIKDELRIFAVFSTDVFSFLKTPNLTDERLDNEKDIISFNSIVGGVGK